VNKKIKIIFLDFDGVFNHQAYYTSSTESIPWDDWGEVFDMDCINRLGVLINESGGPDIVKLVISSSWRHGSGPKEFVGKVRKNKREVCGLEYVKAMWVGRNYPGEVIDITPYFNVDLGKNLKLNSKTCEIKNHSIPRGFEIQRWLEANGFLHWRYYDEDIEAKIQACPIETYCIIDDDADMLIEHQNHFIHTNYKTGFNDIALRRALRILNRPVVYQSLWRE
jgi:hypothetical protein